MEASTSSEISLLRMMGKLTSGRGEVVLRDSIYDALNAGQKTIILALRDVTTVDSSGIGELVSSYTVTANRGVKLHLSNVPARIQDILTITQLITVFDVFDTLEEAIESLGLPREASRLALQSLLGSYEKNVNGLYLTEEQASSGVILPTLTDTAEILARRLLKEPNSIYQLSPRVFEELIAALLEDLGWKIHLTPATRDGGRDIVALIPSEIGNILCLVEAKRYRQDRKVGVGVVRQLYGTVAHEEASYGLLVTSSTFSREAEQFEQAHRYRIGLKDFEDILQWVRRYCRIK